MLFNLQQILELADAKRIAIGAFNVNTLQGIQAVLEAAEELKQPVILQYAPVHGAFIDLDLLGPIMVELAEKAKVPVCVHLDHGEELSVLHQALEIGFTSVMYDGSMLSVEENIKNTRAIADKAHAMGAEVEAELGRVGFASTVTDQSDTDMYTKPEVAAAFCEQSKCDSVAVAIGSAHGFYKETPHLDINRLKEINAATDVPLVLHGGSGIPNDQLAIAFQEGINKFNVGTEYFWLTSRPSRSLLPIRTPTSSSSPRWCRTP